MKRGFIVRFLAPAVAVAVSWAAVVPGATYWVAPSGDDGNPGTEDAPWRSPALGASRLAPGDTLVLAAGTYVLADFEQDVIRIPSGTAGAWITIRGEDGARLVGRNNLAFAFDLAGTSYVRIENVEITHDPAATGEAVWFREGISMVGSPSAHIVLDRVWIHHVDEFGIDAQDVNGLEIVDSRIDHCGFGAVGGPAGEHGGLRDVSIRRTSLSWSGHYYHGGDGSDRPYDRPDGFGIEPSQGPILLEDVTAEHNYGDGLDSKARGTTIRRCLVANNSCDGVKLWGGGSRVENTLIYGRGDGDATVSPWAAVVIGTEESGATFELVNVTVDDALGSNYLMYVQYDEDVPIRLTIRNTIFSGRGPDCPVWLRGTVSLTLDHTLFWFPAGATVLQYGDVAFTAGTVTSLGAGILVADPQFVAPAWGSEGDYHLAAGSPAVDAGSTEGAPADDLDGLPRDDRPDIGAYEYRSETVCTLACSPSAPATATVGQPVRFVAGVTAEGCSSEPTYGWSFGDGSVSSERDPLHTYSAPGAFDWSLSSAADGTACSASGTIEVGPASGYRYLVPAVAHNPGLSGTLWRTDLAVVNSGTADASIGLVFAGPDGSVAREATVPAGGTAVWRNVLESLFDVAVSASEQGVMTVTSDEPLEVAARTYNRTPGGTYGQFVPALEAGAGIGPGGTGVLPLAASGTDARTNVGLVALGDADVSVRLRIVGAGGAPLGGPLVRRVPAGTWLQVDRVFEEAGAEASDTAYITVEVTSSSGEVWAYASVVDGATGDAVTVPLIPVPGG